MRTYRKTNNFCCQATYVPFKPILLIFVYIIIRTRSTVRFGAEIPSLIIMFDVANRLCSYYYIGRFPFARKINNPQCQTRQMFFLPFKTKSRREVLFHDAKSEF